MDRYPANSPCSNLRKEQDEDTHAKNELQTIFLYLKDHVATASMVTEVTGVPQKNICRYKRDLEKQGRLWEVEKKRCKKTGFKAWYLTTDPAKAPNGANQLKMFG